MKELLEYIIKSLVDHPEDVNINVVDGSRSVIFEVKVSPEDVGKIIGREGRIAKAIRTVIKAAAIKEGKRATVEIID